jgi:prepilin-type N-terminal cleavage/methylation domain-containing protein
MKINKFGFTLIEMLVAVTVLAMVIGFGSYGFKKQADKRSVRMAAEEVKMALRLAQSRAVNNEKQSCGDNALVSWCVDINGSTARFVVYCGGGHYRESIDTFGATLSSGISSFCFFALSGESGGGTIEISKGLADSITLIIDQSGVVSEQ